MANTVKLKQSSVAGKVPTTAQLSLGELAVNTNDGKLYFKKSVAGVESIVDVMAATSGGGIPSGSVVPFAQASAPVGWTQITTDAADNRMLRVVKTSGAGTGGSHSPILNNVVPSHTHGFTTGTESVGHTHSGWTGGVNANHSHNARWLGAAPGPDTGWYGNGGYYGGINTSTESADHSHYITTGDRSAAHTHSGSTDNGSSQTNWTPRYVDLILCSKN